jgi:hypothetical protein
MQTSQLAEMTAWFDAFVASFHGETPEAQRNYDLKIDHTRLVRANMERLATTQLPAAEDRVLAAAIAICHDVGRFPQYRDYGTFNDSTSTNHAALAVQTLSNERILDGLDVGRRQTLLQAVALHNVLSLPENLDPASHRFALLIRDADKLDIWRVLIEYYSAGPGERASAVTWELPDTGACSPAALAEVIAGRVLNRSLLATADDFKLLQLSWVFDLNFDESFRMLAERGYFDILAGLLPCQPGCREAVAAVDRHVRSRGAGI